MSEGQKRQRCRTTCALAMGWRAYNVASGSHAPYASWRPEMAGHFGAATVITGETGWATYALWRRPGAALDGTWASPPRWFAEGVRGFVSAPPRDTGAAPALTRAAVPRRERKWFTPAAAVSACAASSRAGADRPSRPRRPATRRRTQPDRSTRLCSSRTRSDSIRTRGRPQEQTHRSEPRGRPSGAQGAAPGCRRDAGSGHGGRAGATAQAGEVGQTQ